MASLRPLADLPVVGVLVDGRTYRHLLYLLIAIPLGFVYSGLASFGLVTGLVLSVVLVGIGVLIAAVIGSRLLAGFERWLANRLLGTDLAAFDDVPADVTGAGGSVRASLTAPSTWRGLGFLSLKFYVSLLALAPVVVLANALRFVAAPVRYPYESPLGEVNGEPVVWAIDTAAEAALATGVGVVGLLVGLHLTNLIAGGARLMAVALLGESEDPESGSEPDHDADDGVTVDPGPDDVDSAAESDAAAGAEADDADADDTATETPVAADPDGFRFDTDLSEADESDRDRG